MRTHTPTDRAALIHTAELWLTFAKTWREAYRDSLDEAFRVYGDGNGVLISGIARDHFPTDVKDTLRTLAHGIGDYTTRSLAYWQQGGKRAHTWRRLAESYRVDGCRY